MHEAWKDAADKRVVHMCSMWCNRTEVLPYVVHTVSGAILTLHSPFDACHHVVALQSLLLAPEVGMFLVSHPQLHSLK
jgi:hypothetical protein